MSEEPLRKLTTIVAADIAGYSRLTAADEEGTLAALRAHRGELIDPTIVKHRGRIANTAGDSILMEFPSVAEAVRCAVEVQRGIAKRNFERTYQLADYVRVQGAELKDGLLHIDLVREVPESMKPRRIEIRGHDENLIEGKTESTDQAA